MQVAARPGHALLAQDAGGETVRVGAHVDGGVADVQLDGQLELVGHAQLAAEGGLLHVGATLL